MQNEVLTPRQMGNKARREYNLKMITDILKLNPKGLSRAELYEKVNLNAETTAALIHIMKRDKKIRICGWFEGKTCRQPLFGYGAAPDVPLPKKPRKNDYERDPSRAPQKLEKIITKEIHKEHKNWMKIWTPTRDVASAWIR